MYVVLSVFQIHRKHEKVIFVNNILHYVWRCIMFAFVFASGMHNLIKHSCHFGRNRLCHNHAMHAMNSYVHILVYIHLTVQHLIQPAYAAAT